MHECDVLYHDECVKIGVKSIIVVSYDEQIRDNEDGLVKGTKIVVVQEMGKRNSLSFWKIKILKGKFI